VTTPPTSRVSTDAVRAQLDRILASARFVNSERLSRFLRYTVEQTMAGHAEQLKEYPIGVEVFGRKDSFDPRIDAIVRVQAITLRSRLKDYYAKEGSDDSVIIEYTKGGYAPAVRDRFSAEPGFNGAEQASIAVLPFVNLSSDLENEYFSDGLTEELISALTNVKGMRVVARTSVFQFKGKAEDVRKIGAQLNARMVLEGSVRKSGDHLRITAQLIDVASGFHTWSRTYRIEMRDLFAVQEEIAAAIVTTLSTMVERSAGRPTKSLDAYHAYLKGRFYLNKWSEAGFRKSIQFFETAIQLDENMAAAWAAHAVACFQLACCGTEPPSELMPKARAAAARALQLDDSLAEAHVALGGVLAIHDWDWAGSETEFARAMELDPDGAPAYQCYSVACLIPQGRLQEALEAAQQACELDPLSPSVNSSVALAHFVLGDYNQAIDYFKKALEIDPNFFLARWWLGVSYLNASMLLKAFAQFRKAGALSKDSANDAIKYSYGHALIGRRDKARRKLEALMSMSQERYFSPVLIAAIHVALAETDAAFDWLDQACEAHDTWLVWLGVDRRFDSIRSHKRFRALLKKLGLSSVARSTTAG
jgi:TolB-like protein/tetratricopeptide (TPR) repeat protein